MEARFKTSLKFADGRVIKEDGKQEENMLCCMKKKGFSLMICLWNWVSLWQSCL